MEKLNTFSIVCYQTAFGGGIVRNVMKSHLTGHEADRLIDHLDLDFESENWVTEKDTNKENSKKALTPSAI